MKLQSDATNLSLRTLTVPKLCNLSSLQASATDYISNVSKENDLKWQPFNHCSTALFSKYVIGVTFGTGSVGGRPPWAWPGHRPRIRSCFCLLVEYIFFVRQKECCLRFWLTFRIVGEFVLVVVDLVGRSTICHLICYFASKINKNQILDIFCSFFFIGKWWRMGEAYVKRWSETGWWWWSWWW